MIAQTFQTEAISRCSFLFFIAGNYQRSMTTSAQPALPYQHPACLQSIAPRNAMTNGILMDERDLGSIGRYYNKQYTQTPLSDLFFHPQNIMTLRDHLEKVLSHLVTTEATNGRIEPGKIHVHVPINDEFAQTMYNVASTNMGFAYTGAWGLQQLNQMFVEWEARVQYYSLRAGALYKQYFLDQNRIKVFPYGEPTRVTKGEITISGSGRSLADPKRQQYQNFLKDVMQVRVDPQTSYPVPLTCQREW